MTEALLVALNAKYVHTSLSVRSLAAYCSGDFSVETLELTINDRFDAMRSQVYHRRAPITGFSCYIWNIELTLKLAQALKRMDPTVAIVLGGPEVSFDAEAILIRHGYVDAILCGEGELPLCELLRQQRACGGSFGSVPTDVLRQIPGLAWREGARVIVNPPTPPLPLDEIPFVYGADCLPQQPQILYYESSRGCPFSCGFCLSGGTGVRYLSEARAVAELTMLAHANVRQVKLVDRTFNADPARARRIWSALTALDTNTNFHFEIAAHLLDDETLALLQKAPAGRFQFEIGVQTTNRDTLRAIRRPDRFEEITRAVAMLKQAGNIHLHLDLIAGLPGESFEQFGRSFDDVFALRPHMLQLGFLKLLKGSRLRGQAQSFGAAYADYPPYEVLSTDAISAPELLSLKLCESALDRFYHAGYTNASLSYLLRSAPSAFDLFLRLGRLIESRSGVSDAAAIEALWLFAKAEGFADDGLRALLLYDWLLPQKRGALPACLGAEPSQEDAAAVRSFYRLRAAEELDLPPQDTQAWRRCAVHVFDVDLFALLAGGVLVHRRCPVLFDYGRKACREIAL